MKRFLSIFLALCLLISLVTVPASAVTNDLGYGMEISGLEQSVVLASNVPTGMYSYDGHILSPFTARSSSSYYLFLYLLASGTYRMFVCPKSQFFHDSSCVSSSDTSYTYMGQDSTYPNTYYFYDYSPDTLSWSLKSTQDTYSWNPPAISLSLVVWANFDIYHVDGVFLAASDPVPVYEESSLSTSFPSTNYSNLTVFKGSFTAVTEPISSDLSGDLALKYTLSDPYVDIIYPASFWGISSTGEYNRLSLSGKFAQTAAFGMQADFSDEISFFANTDLFFDSVQILLDGTVVTDQIELNCNSPPASGIAVSDSGFIYTDTSCIFDSSTTYNISPFESVTFRFYLKNPSGSSNAVFSVEDAASGECSINAFANVTISQFPALVTSYIEPEDPDPEPSVDPDPEPSEDPDPEPSEDPDPEPSDDPDLAGDAVSILGAVIPAAWELLSFEIPGLGVSCKVFVAAILLINLSIVIAHFAFGFGGSGTGYRSGSGRKKEISEKRKGDEK